MQLTHSWCFFFTTRFFFLFIYLFIFKILFKYTCLKILKFVLVFVPKLFSFQYTLLSHEMDLKSAGIFIFFSFLCVNNLFIINLSGFWYFLCVLLIYQKTWRVHPNNLNFRTAAVLFFAAN